MTRSTQPLRFMRMGEVIEMVGVSRATFYRWINHGTYPKQIQLVGKSVVWNERDVIDWMNAQKSCA